MCLGDDPLILGLDIGSTRIKALLVDSRGDEVGAANGTTPFGTGAAGTETTVSALEAAVAGVLAALGPVRRRVAAVGITGMAESGAPLDRHGASLAPVIAWHDPRGAEVAQRLAGRFGPELALRIGRPVRPVSAVAKLGWLVDHGVAGVAQWLGVPELVLHALTASRATEHSLAACSGCWDLADRAWSEDVAEEAGFEARVFPPVMAAGTPMGRISRAAATWSGLTPGTPVTIAGHDHPVAAAGSGADPGDLVNSVGTAETVLARMSEAPDVAAALDRRLSVGVVPGGDGWTLMGGAARSGLVLASAAADLGRSPDELDALVSASPDLSVPPPAGLLDDLRRRQQPRLPTGPPAEVWAGLLAALAACTADVVGRLDGLIAPPARMVAVGGGAASTARLVATARAVPLPVWRSGARQAAARGAAAFAGVAAGWWPSPGSLPAKPLTELRP